MFTSTAGPSGLEKKVQAEVNTDSQSVKEESVCELFQELGPCTLMGSDNTYPRVSGELADAIVEVTVCNFREVMEMEGHPRGMEEA